MRAACRKSKDTVKHRLSRCEPVPCWRRPLACRQRGGYFSRGACGTGSTRKNTKTGVLKNTPVLSVCQIFCLERAMPADRPFSSSGARYCPVKDFRLFATCSGVPVATMRPPSLPPSGPRSMM